MQPEKKKVYGYKRVSTEEQVDGASLENQERAIRAYADTHGLEVVNIYSDEGFSAKTAKRPQLQEMLKAIASKNSDVSGVVVYNLSRLSRSVDSFYGEISAYLSHKNIRLYSTQESIDDSPYGQVAKVMFLAMHQLDNSLKAEVVRDNMRLLAREGWWQGKIPYGYKPVRVPIGLKTLDGKNKSRLTLEPNNQDDLADKIKLLLTRFSKGDITQTDLIGYAESINLKSATGKQYTVQSINNMLRYSVYAGYTRNKLTDNSLVKARHDGLISLETYQRNQDLLNNVTPPRLLPRFTNDYALKHTLLCHSCHKPLTGSAPRNGSGVRSPRYHCTRCPGTGSISTREMDEVFRDLLEDVTPTEGTVRLFKTIVKRTAGRKLKSVNKEIDDVRSLLSKADADIVKATQGYFDGDISKEEKDSFQEVRRLDRFKLDHRLATLRGVQRLNENTIDRVCDFINKPVSMWQDADADTRIILQSMIMPDGIEFDIKARSFGTATISPLYRLETNKKDPSETKESLMVTSRRIELRLPG